MKYPPGLSYACEKFGLAVHALAVGPGDVRSRLRTAFMEFSAVQEKDVPDDLVEDFRWIVRELTKREPHVDEGRLNATLFRMQNRTGTKIAERICSLSSRLDDYHEDRTREDRR